MRQSEKDDHYDELATFTECTYLNLVLAAMKRELNEDEVHILQGAALTLRLNNHGAHSIT